MVYYYVALVLVQVKEIERLGHGELLLCWSLMQWMSLRVDNQI
jgi:hypothetical protein